MNENSFLSILANQNSFHTLVVLVKIVLYQKCLFYAKIVEAFCLLCIYTRVEI